MLSPKANRVFIWKVKLFTKNGPSRAIQLGLMLLLAYKSHFVVVWSCQEIKSICYAKVYEGFCLDAPVDAVTSWNRIFGWEGVKMRKPGYITIRRRHALIETKEKETCHCLCDTCLWLQIIGTEDKPNDSVQLHLIGVWDYPHWVCHIVARYNDQLLEFPRRFVQ